MLYAETGGDLYKRLPPAQGEDLSGDDWLKSATRIGTGGWSGFKFLFFDPQGILYGVRNGDDGQFLSGAPPINETDNWQRRSQPPIGYYFNEYSLLFFMANGELYGVKNNALFKFTDIADLSGSKKRIGSNPWKNYKFLMAPLRHE